MTGTHDTEPLAVWWDELRAPTIARRLLALPLLRRARASTDPTQPWTDALARRCCIELAYRSGSRRSVPAHAGPVRLARSHQRAGHGRARELDLVPALAGRSARRRCRGRASGRRFSRRLAAADRPASAASDYTRPRPRLTGRLTAMSEPPTIRSASIPLQQGALEIAYIEEYFNEFPTRKTAAEIMQRLEGREFQILMAEASLPDDAATVVPVSYKVSHELRAEETDPKLADLVERLRDVGRVRRPARFSTTGSARRAWTGAARDTSAR